MPINMSDKAMMAISALSIKDQARIRRSLDLLETGDQTDWIRAHTSKLADIPPVDDRPIWSLKATQNLRILYHYLPNEQGGPRIIAVLDVLPHDRLEKLRLHHGGNP